MGQIETHKISLTAVHSSNDVCCCHSFVNVLQGLTTVMGRVTHCTLTLHHLYPSVRHNKVTESLSHKVQISKHLVS